MYSFQTKIRYSQIGPKGYMKIPALVDGLQDCCAAQMEELGLGLDWLGERGFGWFITNWDIKIKALPSMHEDVVFKTWPYSFHSVFGHRNFTLERPDGERLVEVDSLWVFMNTRDNHPARITPEMLEIYQTHPRLPGEWGDRKLPVPEYSLEVGREVVGQARIDTNRHMNNAQYVDMAYTALDPGVRIDRIRMAYKKPAVLGDEVVVRRADEGQICRVLLCDTNDGIFAQSEFEVEK